jgi:LPXTG-motif cell wall-anchored protein
MNFVHTMILLAALTLLATAPALAEHNNAHVPAPGSEGDPCDSFTGDAAAQCYEELGIGRTSQVSSASASASGVSSEQWREDQHDAAAASAQYASVPTSDQYARSLAAPTGALPETGGASLIALGVGGLLVGGGLLVLAYRRITR